MSKKEIPDVRIPWDEYKELMRAAGLSPSRAGVQDVICILKLYGHLEKAIDKQARETWTQAISEFRQKRG